jgi:hypothetical protein
MSSQVKKLISLMQTYILATEVLRINLYIIVFGKPFGKRTFVRLGRSCKHDSEINSSVFWDIAPYCPLKDPRKIELFTISVARTEILHDNTIFVSERGYEIVDWTRMKCSTRTSMSITNLYSDFNWLQET